MATSDERIRLLLEARNNASAALQQVQGQLSGLNKAAGIAASGMTAIASAAAIGGLVQLGGAIYDLAQNAANVAAIRNSFEGLAAGVGQSSQGMLNALKATSQGTIAEYDLMLSANRAMMLGVADSSEEMTALMNVAISRGRAMGLSTTQAFGDLVTGLGRASPLILDNLGIVVNAEQVNADYAKQLGKTAAQLTEVEKKQALVNVVMKEAEGIDLSNVELAADDFSRMSAAVADLKVELGEMFLPMMAAIAGGAASGLRSINDELDAMKEGSERLQQANLNSYIESLRALEQTMSQMGRDKAAAPDFWTDEAEQSLQRIYTQHQAVYAEYLTVLGQMNAAAAEAQASQENLGESMQLAVAGATEFNAIIAVLAANMDGLSDTQINNLADSAMTTFNNLVAGGMNAADALKEVQRQLNIVIPALNGTNEAARAAAGGISTLGQVAPIAAHGVSTLGIEAATAAANLGVLMNAMGALQGVQNLSKARDAIDGAFGSQDARAGWADVRQEMGRVGEEGVKGAKASADIAQSMYMSYNNTKAMGGAASQVNQEFNALKGTVAGILQGSLTLDGIKVDDMLPREDEINENARRLAAIANEGLIGQDWFGEFAAEVPDIAKMLQESGDPKTAAAQLLRDFQDGLVPELLDKEQAKERVKRMLLGQENMAALANEIALELSREMGISLSQAQAAVGQTLGTGTAATGVDGKGAPLLDGTSEGNKFVDGLTTQITVRQASIMQSGASSGATWGMGFMETVTANVPTALIELLVVLITPGVKKKLSDEGSRTGAR